jgi:plasmid replication initiation protein
MAGTERGARRRVSTRAIRLDRSLEALPLFRLSDSADDGVISLAEEGDGTGRWRVIPNPGDRLPGTFDQDVYVELLRRYHEDGEPADGAISFTLHAFLRAMGRRVDGRTYEQLRGALSRLERTTLESHLMYSTPSGTGDLRFTLLQSVAVERRRTLDREQLPLFPAIASGEPGVARVTLAAVIRENLAADHAVSLSAASYWSLGSPVARRLYRLLEVARADGRLTWRIGLDRLAEQLPLAQRYPSHLQRVLQPAHDMLVEQGILRNAAIRQQQREWFVDYVLGSRPA